MGKKMTLETLAKQMHAGFAAVDKKMERDLTASGKKMEGGFATGNKRMDQGFAAADRKMKEGFVAADKKMDLGFTATDKKIEALAEDIADINQNMATKDHVIALHTQNNSIEAQLRGMRYTRLEGR